MHRVSTPRQPNVAKSFCNCGLGGSPRCTNSTCFLVSFLHSGTLPRINSLLSHLANSFCAYLCSPPLPPLLLCPSPPTTVTDLSRSFLLDNSTIGRAGCNATLDPLFFINDLVALGMLSAAMMARGCCNSRSCVVAKLQAGVHMDKHTFRLRPQFFQHLYGKTADWRSQRTATRPSEPEFN